MKKIHALKNFHPLFLMVRPLGPVQTPLQACAEPNHK